MKNSGGVAIARRPPTEGGPVPATTPRRRPCRPSRRTVLLAAGGTLGVLGLGGAAGLAAFTHSVDSYVDPWTAKVADAGYVQRTASAGDVTFSYAEGPDAGPPLVLLHAQLMDWFDYSRVLPSLAERYHVFVVDYQGHGATTYPAGYPMTADRIGADLADLLEQLVGGAAYISGNSSGGLLTVWLAANRPDLVRAAVLEDPPLFASEYPRIKETIADRAFRSSYAAATEGDDGDFLTYWLEYNSTFFDNHVFRGSARVIRHFVDSYRRTNPGRPVELGFVRDDTVRLLIRGLDSYDPRFGAAFYDGTWNGGFDHADALARVSCPALLLHADWSFTADGILDGAMSQDDADRAAALLPDGSYRRVASSHVVHLAEPALFLDELDGFLARQT